MKRFLFVLMLLLMAIYQTIFASSGSGDNEILRRDVLEYDINYTDSLKHEVKDFWVWYNPEEYKDLLADKVAYRENLKITNQEAKNFIEKIESLFLERFGYTKVFNKDGHSNVKGITYSLHISTGQVYLRAIVFTGDAYNLITDEDILSFAREFNKNITLYLNDKDEVEENVMRFYQGVYIFTSGKKN